MTIQLDKMKLPQLIEYVQAQLVQNEAQLAALKALHARATNGHGNGLVSYPGVVLPPSRRMPEAIVKKARQMFAARETRKPAAVRRSPAQWREGILAVVADGPVNVHDLRTRLSAGVSNTIYHHITTALKDGALHRVRRHGGWCERAPAHHVFAAERPRPHVEDDEEED